MNSQVTFSRQAVLRVMLPSFLGCVPFQSTPSIQIQNIDLAYRKRFRTCAKGRRVSFLGKQDFLEVLCLFSPQELEACGSLVLTFSSSLFFTCYCDLSITFSPKVPSTGRCPDGHLPHLPSDLGHLMLVWFCTFHPSYAPEVTYHLMTVSHAGLQTP